MRLIDADKLREAFDNMPYEITTAKHCGWDENTIRRLIAEAPEITTFYLDVNTGMEYKVRPKEKYLDATNRR